MARTPNTEGPGPSLDDYLKDDFALKQYITLKKFKQAYPGARANFEIAFFEEFYDVLQIITSGELNSPLALFHRLQYGGFDTLLTKALIDYADQSGDANLQGSAALTMIRAIDFEMKFDIADEENCYLLQGSASLSKRVGVLKRYLDSLVKSSEKLAYLIARKSALQTYRDDDRLRRKSTEVLDAVLDWIDRRMREIIKIDELQKPSDDTVVEAADDASKRLLTRQLAMLLIDELFPNLSSATTTSKAEFLSLLTGWNVDGLRSKWSDYRRGNPESLAADMKKVAEWKRKLKITN